MSYIISITNSHIVNEKYYKGFFLNTTKGLYGFCVEQCCEEVECNSYNFDKTKLKNWRIADWYVDVPLKKVPIGAFLKWNLKPDKELFHNPHLYVTWILFEDDGNFVNSYFLISSLNSLENAHQILWIRENEIKDQTFI